MNVRRLLAALMASLLAQPAVATTVVPVSTKEMSKRADIICTGACVRSKAFVDPAATDGVRINTNYLIKVDETLKGDTQQYVVITEWGGQVGDTLQWIAGSPRFETGEKALVFLKKTGDGLVTIGLSQGKYRIYKEEGAGKELVRRDLSGLEFINPKKKTYMEKPKDPDKQSLVDFIAEIERYVGRRKK